MNTVGDYRSDNEDDDVDETLVLARGIRAFTTIKDGSKMTFTEVTLHMELKIIVLSAQ
jgi:hypothetical protein